MILLVVILATDGCMIDFGGSWACADVAGAEVLRRLMLAPVSRSAIEFKLVGLVQSG